MIRLTRRYEFPAAHVLASPALSQADNARIFGKCANPHGHGHDYGVEVCVSGPIEAETGQILSPDLLDDIFDEAVRGPWSHRMLNELPAFRSRVPTAENIALILFDELAPRIADRSGARLVGVRVVETTNNHFEVGEPR
jgi:6-pyruvoyltetrahydropterin/6-carboxytetrahydropterin synthase